MKKQISARTAYFCTIGAIIIGGAIGLANQQPQTQAQEEPVRMLIIEHVTSTSKLLEV